MDKFLNEIEVRVLGCLIEKELTTPDYYPMTTNALTNACNQKSNRDPILSLDDTTVFRTLEFLREKGLVGLVSGAGIRAQKWKHNFNTSFQLEKRQVALICELLLRGPQTLGELRTRAERMCKFESLEEVEQIINLLKDREEKPLVLKLLRQAGQKECRYIHLLCGKPNIEENDLVKDNVALRVQAENERIEKLEMKVKTLEEDLDNLTLEFLDFKRQFE